ncbi:MAG: FIST C-terminal domain-containing protein [Bacteroidia bacterium]|nr:FIST C-terminal domain-containing protein [Bacteroidia bacterium]
MKAKSIYGPNPDEIKTAFEQAMVDGFQPTLAVVFMPVELGHTEIVQFLKKRDIAIFGANTPGKFTDRGLASNEVVILLMDLNPDFFRIVVEEVDSYEQAFEKAQLIAQSGLENFSRPAFILSAASYNDTPLSVLAEGITSIAGKNATLIGGMAGGKPVLNECLVFSHEQESDKGIISLIIDQDKVEVADLAVSGWKPAGTPKIVTKSEGAWIITIDDQPALDMLVKFTGLELNLDDQKDIFQQIGSLYPLQIIQSKGSPVMNPPMMVNRENGAVLFGFPIQQGSQVLFSLPPDFEVVETVVESAHVVKKTRLPEADAMLIFSCIGRLSNLGPLIEEELDGLRDVWGVPMVGFFSLGEFGTPIGGNAGHHGTTCSWVAFKEKKL